MNIILIGFKSSGKSSVGLKLAKISCKEFVDTDCVVEELFFRHNAEHISCREIQSRFGSSAMRALEAEAISLLVEKDNLVIATGGGIILDEDNVKGLHKLGLIVFMNVPLLVLENRLKEHASSPLFKEKGVAAVYQERQPLYAAAADIRYDVPEKETLEDVAKSIHNLVAKIDENI